MRAVLTNENTISVSRVGSALEADKKINLALKISVIVCAAKASRATAQGRPFDVRGNGLHPASGMSLARPAGYLWSMELRLHPVAALVSGRTVGQVAAGAGAERPWPIAVSRRQSHQGASGCEQPRWWPTKSSHRAHQRWSEHQAQCLGGRARTTGQFEFGVRTGVRCCRCTSGGASNTAGHNHCRRQRLRQRRLPNAVAAVGKPGLHSASLQPPSASELASWSLSKAAQGREFVPAFETPAQDRDAL